MAKAKEKEVTGSTRGRKIMLVKKGDKSGKEVARVDIIRGMWKDGKGMKRGDIVKALKEDYDHECAYQIVFAATKAEKPAADKK